MLHYPCLFLNGVCGDDDDGAALVDDLVHGGLFVAGTGHNVLVIGRNITTKY